MVAIQAYEESKKAKDVKPESKIIEAAKKEFENLKKTPEDPKSVSLAFNAIKTENNQYKEFQQDVHKETLAEEAKEEENAEKSKVGLRIVNTS